MKPVGGLDLGDADQRQLLDQPVLQGAEGTLRATPGLRRVGGDVLDAELVQGAPDLAAPILVDLAAGLGGVEVVAAAVGIQRAGQAVLGKHRP